MSRIALLFLLAAGAAAHAQAPALVLGPPTTFTAEFTKIGSVRELPDGSLLVADVGENLIRQLDPRGGAATAISRTGQGPGEYQSLAGGFYALRGDTTLLDDLTAHRWLLLSGATMLRESGATQLLSAPNGAFVGSKLLGADTLGHLLLQLSAGRKRVREEGEMVVEADTAILRLASANLVDTVTVGRFFSGLWTTYGWRVRPNGVLAPSGYAFSPLNSGVQAELFSDGWMAIAYPSPYHVEWRRPDGTMVRGRALPFTPPKLDDAQKTASVAWFGQQIGMRALAERPGSWIASESVVWPDAVPPFVCQSNLCESLSLQAAPDGKLVVRRTWDAAFTGEHYDIIDRSGTLSGTLALGPGEAIVGFGRASVYISAPAANDLQQLRRYGWPLRRQ